MSACRMFLFFAIIIFCGWLPFASGSAAESAAEELGERAIFKIFEEIGSGVTKEFAVKVRVQDCETKEPVWGARVELDYHRTASRPVATMGECSDEIQGVTDREGKVKLILEVEGCPYRILMDKDDKEEEKLYMTVSADGYEETAETVDSGKVNICLQKPGFRPVRPALQIEYPEYEIDYDRFKKIFGEIAEINNHEMGEKISKKSYTAIKYYHASSRGSSGFDAFLEKIESFSSLNEIPFLKEVLENRYPLPYKKIKFSDEDSWRAGEYYYEIGRGSAAKALLNIADDQIDELLPKSTDIPEDYINVLSEAGINLSADDYWDYLSGKYVSRARNPLWEGTPRPDSLIFTEDKLKENLPPARYADCLFKLYQIASIKSVADKIWQKDKDRLAETLFGIRSPLFIAEVKKQLPVMEADDTTRKYLYYLYTQGEYDCLAKGLKENKELIKAFLAEDSIGVTSWNTSTGETKDLEVENCLLIQMPLVTERIKREIESYMKDVSTKYSYSRWWIRNLSYINKPAAESVAREIYSKASVQPCKNNYKYEKRLVLRGAAEGKLTGLCQDVFADLEIKDELKRDYFSVAQERIHYLCSSCPQEFNKIVSDFNVGFLKDKIKTNAFEANYSINLTDYRDSIWEGVEKYFPEDKAIAILEEYICGTDEVIRGTYGGSNVLPARYPIKCLCEKLENDLPTLNKCAVSRLTEYLDRCYPEAKARHQKMKLLDWEKDLRDRNYRGLLSITQGLTGYVSATPVFSEQLRAFFLGTASKSEGLEPYMSNWSMPLDSDKAFRLLGQAINSKEDLTVQAALYACSFYPGEPTGEITERQESFANGDKYPEYIYAAWSLAASNPKKNEVWNACVKSAAFHLKTIQERSPRRYRQDFAFNTLLTIDLCGKVGNESDYKKMLSIVVPSDVVGRYASFQTDIERIITSYDIKLDELIDRLFNSSNAVEIISGIRVAGLKKRVLDNSRLNTLLHHDNSFIRIAVAKYVREREELYHDIFEGMKKNSNRRVRGIASDIGVEDGPGEKAFKL